MTTLTDLLPPPSDNPPDPDAIFSAFADWAKDRGLPLYPHQEEALIEVVMGSNVILSTPTGSGQHRSGLGSALPRPLLTRVREKSPRMPS